MYFHNDFSQHKNQWNEHNFYNFFFYLKFSRCCYLCLTSGEMWSRDHCIDDFMYNHAWYIRIFKQTCPVTNVTLNPTVFLESFKTRAFINDIWLTLHDRKTSWRIKSPQHDSINWATLTENSMYENVKKFMSNFKAQYNLDFNSESLYKV